MKGSLYLALRYLAFHRVTTAVLIFSIALIFFVPAALQVLVDRTERKLTARAEATPLLVGAKGSPVELVLNSLYFGADVPATLPFAEVRRGGCVKLPALSVVQRTVRFDPPPWSGTTTYGGQ